MLLADGFRKLVWSCGCGGCGGSGGGGGGGAKGSGGKLVFGDKP